MNVVEWRWIVVVVVVVVVVVIWRVLGVVPVVLWNLNGNIEWNVVIVVVAFMVRRDLLIVIRNADA